MGRTRLRTTPPDRNAQFGEVFADIPVWLTTTMRSMRVFAAISHIPTFRREVAKIPDTRDHFDMSAQQSNPVFVHPNGLCESDQVGAGTRVWAFAHVLAGAVVGRDCNICDHAYVENGVRLGDRVTVKNRVLLFEGVTIRDDVFLGPAVVFTNDFRPRASIKRTGDQLMRTLVEHGATLGAGVVVVCGTTIGAHAFVGAGSVVTKDIPPYGFAVGNPARQIGWACVCGNRLNENLTCGCGEMFRLTEHGLSRLSPRKA